MWNIHILYLYWIISYMLGIAEIFMEKFQNYEVIYFIKADYFCSTLCLPQINQWLLVVFFCWLVIRNRSPSGKTHKCIKYHWSANSISWFTDIFRRQVKWLVASGPKGNPLLFVNEADLSTYRTTESIGLEGTSEVIKSNLWLL